MYIPVHVTDFLSMIPRLPAPRLTLLTTWLAFVLFLGGCASLEPAGHYVPEDGSGYLLVVDTLQVNPGLESLVSPFRADMAEEVSRVIGRATATLTKDSPEGALGNMAADAMLYAISADIAITNNGGLRVPLAEGPITVGHMFELMPFENMLVVLQLTGEHVLALANELAATNGEPVAGISLEIAEGGTASNVRVAGQPVDPDRTYRVATSDYLANGGGNMPSLWLDVPREEPHLTLRDTFIAYVQSRDVIEPVLEGRIK